MHNSKLLIRDFYKALAKPSTTSQIRNYILPAYTHKHFNQTVSNVTYSCFNRSMHSSTLKCWNCGANREVVTSLTCDKCNMIQQPPNEDNYFKVFNIQEDFDIDQKWLTTRYRELQTILHPDKFSNKSDEEKIISADYSSLVNKAYNTLQLPLKRAIHMLNLKGENIDEDQKVTDANFLMEIMELNEEVEAAKSPDDLRKLNENNKRILRQLGEEVSKYFKENNIENAKTCIIKMKYFNSVSLHINGLLRERGVVD